MYDLYCEMVKHLKNYLDKNFDKRYRSGDRHVRLAAISELVVAWKLYSMGFELKQYRTRKSSKGPDFLCFKEEQKIWVEVSCPA